MRPRGPPLLRDGGEVLLCERRTDARSPAAGCGQLAGRSTCARPVVLFPVWTLIRENPAASATATGVPRCRNARAGPRRLPGQPALPIKRWNVGKSASASSASRCRSARSRTIRRPREEIPQLPACGKSPTRAIADPFHQPGNLASGLVPAAVDPNDEAFHSPSPRPSPTA
jgi:hypothetical protein